MKLEGSFGSHFVFVTVPVLAVAAAATASVFVLFMLLVLFVFGFMAAVVFAVVSVRILHFNGGLFFFF